MVINKSSEAAASVRLLNAKQRDFEWVVMSRSGEADRRVVERHIKDGKKLNALQTLGYGERGLVDAVIVSKDRVLTREGLEQYYTGNHLDTPQKKEKFNTTAGSVKKVVHWLEENQPNQLQPVKTYSPESFGAGQGRYYQGAKTTSRTPQEALTQFLREEGYLDDMPPTLGGGSRFSVRYYLPEEARETRPDPFLTSGLQNRVQGFVPPFRYELRNLPPLGETSTYLRDAIYFSAEISSETGNNLYSSLVELFDKKQMQLDAGEPIENVAIVENTPGGLVLVTDMLKSLMEQHPDIPVDIIVQGMGASAGSRMLGISTGRNYATPNAVILLHQASGGGYGSSLNADTESLQEATQNYIYDIAERSGRPEDEVEKDFQVDFWINPVEALLYGDKGLIDGILVGPHHVITRDAIMGYLEKQRGGPEEAQDYIKDTFKVRRKAKHIQTIDKHEELADDPLANPLALIQTLVDQGAVVDMDTDERFAGSRGIKPTVATAEQRPLDLYMITDHGSGGDDYIERAKKRK